jgi:hypothetical protein
VLECAVSRGLPAEHVTRLGMHDRLIAHATRKEQLAEVGLKPSGIACAASAMRLRRRSGAGRGGARLAVKTPSISVEVVPFGG